MRELWEPLTMPITLGVHRLQHRVLGGKSNREGNLPQDMDQALEFRKHRLMRLFGEGLISLTVVENERLDPLATDKKTLRVTFEGKADFEVFPNDFLSVRWKNSPELVEDVLSRLADDPEKLIRIATWSNQFFPGKLLTTSLRRALSDHIEIQTVSQGLLSRYGLGHVNKLNAEATTRHRSFHKQANGQKPPGEEDFVDDHRSVALLSVLERENQSGKKPNARQLLARQDRMFLRPYTMSEFKRTGDGTFRTSITVSVIEKQLMNVDGSFSVAPGRATSYLANLQKGDSAEGFILPDRHLFPQSLERRVPLIIVCTGSGIAGTLSLLRSGYDGGPLWVVYGVRNRRINGLYLEELETFAASGVINRLDIAESRPDGTLPKQYVQDVLKNEAEKVANLLREGAHLFMGGRISMGISVNRAIRDIIVRTGLCADIDDANKRLKSWYDTLQFQASVSRV